MFAGCYGYGLVMAMLGSCYTTYHTMNRFPPGASSTSTRRFLWVQVDKMKLNKAQFLPRTYADVYIVSLGGCGTKVTFSRSLSAKLLLAKLAIPVESEWRRRKPLNRLDSLTTHVPQKFLDAVEAARNIEEPPWMAIQRKRSGAAAAGEKRKHSSKRPIIPDHWRCPSCFEAGQKKRKGGGGKADEKEEEG